MPRSTEQEMWSEREGEAGPEFPRKARISAAGCRSAHARKVPQLRFAPDEIFVGSASSLCPTACGGVVRVRRRPALLRERISQLQFRDDAEIPHGAATCAEVHWRTACGNSAALPRWCGPNIRPKLPEEPTPNDKRGPAPL